jgi:hypothetical protein
MSRNVLSIIVFCLISSKAFAEPTQLLPDLITSPAPLSDNSIDFETIPGKKLLRLSNSSPNVGVGKLELRGGKILEDGKREVFQRIYLSNGRFVSRLAGVFEYHPEHKHIHFKDYAVYRLRIVMPDSGVGSIVASSEKISFCIRNSVVYDRKLPGFNPKSEYKNCSSDVQGIGVGYADFYGKNLYGQWIDITDVPPGQYWIESEVDPLNRLKESNEDNNVAHAMVNID